MDCGPQRIDHPERIEIAEVIAGQLKAHFGDRLLALGIFGSTGKSTDGVYSDIEMHCVLESYDESHTLEWSNGDWKTEVSISSVKSILRKAGEVGWDWPVTHSAYAFVQPIYDPTNLFIHLRKTAISQPEGKFRQAMRKLIVEEMFELAGKIRSAQERANFGSLAWFAGNLAFQGACLAGLENRFLYPSAADMFGAALELDHLPQGYSELCRMVMAGDLSRQAETISACESFWSGVNVWASERSISLIDELDNLLKRQAI
jgi:kanamycin nucleotidyltransferase